MKPLLTLSLLILAPAILKADPLPKEAQDLLDKKQEMISNHQ
ncbi:hypothetical protein Rhal01_03662 [Rubritalea halochordaticola]|uniref:Uncharacterized protein n=1 Tax=Rubritalea halochordaticola TaxID=714537 RepID=A0ABP9V8S1_9BACT